MSLRNPSSSGFGHPSSSSPTSSADASKIEDGGSSSGSGGSSEYRYEELHDGLTCPTCQGTGRIPRGQEDSLVALIPYGDERLRPRRTVLYVCIAVFTSLLAAGLLVFFLFPRGLTLAAYKVDTLAVSLNKKSKIQYLWLNIQNTFNVTNNNFVSADLNTLTVQALYRDTIRGSSMTTIDTSVPLRHSTQIRSEINVTFYGLDTDFALVMLICDPAMQSISHNLLFKFQVTLETSFLSHTEESTSIADFFVPCVLTKDHERMQIGV